MSTHAGISYDGGAFWHPIACLIQARAMRRLPPLEGELAYTYQADPDRHLMTQTQGGAIPGPCPRGSIVWAWGRIWYMSEDTAGIVVQRGDMPTCPWGDGEPRGYSIPWLGPDHVVESCAILRAPRPRGVREAGPDPIARPGLLREPATLVLGGPQRGPARRYR